MPNNDIHRVSNKTSILLMFFLFFCTFMLNKLPKNDKIMSNVTMINKEHGEILAKTTTNVKVGG